MTPRWTVLLAAGLLALVACASDDGDTTDPIDPPPHEGTDRVTFRVYAEPAGKAPELRWKGNGAGPDPDSPEQTAVPYIGYGQPFRVEWEADFEDAPVEGYRVRVSQLPTGPFLPRDDEGNSVFGDLTSWQFQNAFAAAGLEDEDCPEGDDCAGRLRFDSGLHRIEMLARNTNGILSDRELGLLEFDVNYPPTTELPVDPVDCGDDVGYPQYTYQPQAGDPITCSFAPGDTVPMGSIVRFRVAGQDRLPGRDFPDGLCCDLRLDLETPEIRHQARISMTAVTEDGEPLAWELLYSPTEIEDVFQFAVAPLDYVMHGRAVDEHGRRDPVGATMPMVGGFAPRIVSVAPSGGTRLILRDPASADTWPENGYPYQVQDNATRHWSPGQRRYLNAPTPTSMQVQGAWFTFAPELVGASHPKEPLPQGVRSWAYEMIGEYDPLNTIQNGSGFDRLGVYSDPPDPNLWVFQDEERIPIWVPTLFWSSPELLDPEGECPVPEWCDIGEDLRTYLGAYIFRVRGRSTGGAEVFQQGGAEVVEGTALRTSIELLELGRLTDLVETSFEIRLGLDDGNGNLDTLWPAP